MSPVDPQPDLSLRSRLRRAWRVPVLLVVILGGFPLALLGRLLLAGAPRARVRFTSRFFRAWSRLALRVLNVRVATAGPLPPPPFLLVTNHLSYLDILVLASHLPAVFVSKIEVESWPILGAICTAMGTIYIDRGSRRDIPRVLAEIEAAMDRGMGVVFFPEGTSSRGDTVEPFKSPLLALPVRLGRPVHHATLHYRTPAGEPAAEDAVCFWQEVPFAQHALGLVGLRAVAAAVHYGVEPIVEADRKRLAERLREAILERYPPHLESSDADPAGAARMKSPPDLP